MQHVFSLAEAISKASSANDENLGQAFQEIIPDLERFLTVYRSSNHVLTDEQITALYNDQMLNRITDLSQDKIKEDLKPAYLAIGILSEIAYWCEMRKDTKEINPTEIFHKTFFSYIAAGQRERAIQFYRVESANFTVDDNLREIARYIGANSRRNHTSSKLFEA